MSLRFGQRGVVVWVYAQLLPGGVQGWRACLPGQPGCPTRGAPSAAARQLHLLTNGMVYTRPGAAPAVHAEQVPPDGAAFELLRRHHARRRLFRPHPLPRLLGRRPRRARPTRRVRGAHRRVRGGAAAAGGSDRQGLDHYQPQAVRKRPRQNWSVHHAVPLPQPRRDLLVRIYATFTKPPTNP